jgi:ATP-dependent Clp protease adaptor protein ClpS|tara:strand:+ start:708 stop:1007 length:300 start_codon:yes stop_codon:yes gene_type:complete
MAKTQTNTISKSRIEFPERFNVVLLNDDFTPMDFVVQLLIEIFNRTIEEARDITHNIHENGRGIAGSYGFEIAEQKKQEAVSVTRFNKYPLTIVVEPVE